MVRLIQIDAFAAELFRGNPAAVMPLPQWLPDDLLQAVAAENNLSETAFYVYDLPPDVTAPDNPAYHLRWFTPAMEVDLCGHATLAAAGQLFDDVHPRSARVSFWTRSGWLHVERRGRILSMDLPAEPLAPVAADDPLVVAASAATGVTGLERFRATDLVLTVADEAAVRAVTPDFTAMRRLPVRGVIVTAPGKEVDFVSRWFGGTAGIDEDPVTGSGHSQIAPYWAGRLGRPVLRARQLSARGGEVICEVDGDRVRVGGAYRRYLDGIATIG